MGECHHPMKCGQWWSYFIDMITTTHCLHSKTWNLHEIMSLLLPLIHIQIVVTLALGSWPREGIAKVRDKREAREAHLILLGVQESVREWTLTLPSELPLWGVGIPMDFWIFREWLQGSKPIGLKKSLYHWKAIKTQMSKMGLQDPFGH